MEEIKPKTGAVLQRVEPTLGTAKEVANVAPPLLDDMNFEDAIELFRIVQLTMVDNQLSALKEMNETGGAPETLRQLQDADMHRAISFKALMDVLNAQKLAGDAISAKVQGNDSLSMHKAHEASSHLEAAADGLEVIAEFIPKSRTMARVIAMRYAADHALSDFKDSATNLASMTGAIINRAFVAADDKLSAAEQKVSELATSGQHLAVQTVDGFSHALRATAQGMRAFSQKIANIPGEIKRVAKHQLVSIAAAAVLIGSSLMSQSKHKAEKATQKLGEINGLINEKISDASARVNAQAEAAKEYQTEVRRRAWGTLNRLAEAALKITKDVKAGVERKAEIAEQHTKGILNVARAAGQAVRKAAEKAGTAIVQNYQEGIEQAEAEQQARKDRKKHQP